MKDWAPRFGDYDNNGLFLHNNFLLNANFSARWQRDNTAYNNRVFLISSRVPCQLGPFLNVKEIHNTIFTRKQALWVMVIQTRITVETKWWYSFATGSTTCRQAEKVKPRTNQRLCLMRQFLVPPANKSQTLSRPEIGKATSKAASVVAQLVNNNFLF